MAVDPDFFIAVMAMAAASYACRVAGFVLMGYITITPRLESALKAIPLAVMIGIVTPAVSAGKLPETAGLAVVVLVMKLTRTDVLAAVAGAATVALCRYALV